VCEGSKWLAPSHLAELLNDFVVPARAPRSSDTPALAVPLFKFKTVGDRSFSSAGPKAWNSLPHTLRAGALASSNTTPGTVSSALHRCYLLAANVGGHASDLSFAKKVSAEFHSRHFYSATIAATAFRTL